MEGLILIVIVVIFTLLSMYIDKKRKESRRTGSARNEYEKEQTLTQNNVSIVTSASMQQVKNSINSRLTFSQGTKDDIKGDNYKILADTGAYITYLHNSTLNVMSNLADEFRVQVIFNSVTSGLRVTIHGAHAAQQYLRTRELQHAVICICYPNEAKN